MNEVLFVVPYMHIDETPLQVLRSGKAIGAEHYIVVPSASRVMFDLSFDIIVVDLDFGALFGGVPGSRSSTHALNCSRTGLGFCSRS